MMNFFISVFYIMKIKFIFVLILILAYVYAYVNLNQDMLSEMFSSAYQTFQSYAPLNAFKYPLYPLTNSAPGWYYNFFPTLDGYTNFPWWNTSLGNTTNMSYDLRGDPLIIPRTPYVWNNPTTFPIYNPPI